MKFLIKLFAAFTAMIFTLITVIKIVQGCSYKEAVGIAEEFLKEMKESCCKCCSHNFSMCDEKKSGKKA